MQREMFLVRSRCDFGNSFLPAQVSFLRASATPTSTYAVMQVAPGDAVRLDSACCLLRYLVGLQWDTWIPRWSWVSMAKMPQLSLYLFSACLLCLHPLLTLCIWIPPLTAVLSKYSVSLSSARVGAASIAMHGYKSLVAHPTALL